MCKHEWETAPQGYQINFCDKICKKCGLGVSQETKDVEEKCELCKNLPCQVKISYYGQPKVYCSCKCHFVTPQPASWEERWLELMKSCGTVEEQIDFIRTLLADQKTELRGWINKNKYKCDGCEEVVAVGDILNLLDQ